jgi:hypothetical protein
LKGEEKVGVKLAVKELAPDPLVKSNRLWLNAEN